MDLQLKVCDRCDKTVERNGARQGPYYKLTVSYHHPKEFVICETCEYAFRKWLAKDVVSDVRS